jgi:hypothetical protein
MRPENQDSFGGSDAYSLFLCAVKSSYKGLLSKAVIHFNQYNLYPNGPMEERCNLFAMIVIKDPSWVPLGVPM